MKDWITIHACRIGVVLVALCFQVALAAVLCGSLHAEPGGKETAAEDANKVRLLEQRMGDLHTRSLAWVRMGYYDEAIRELNEAADLSQAIRVITGKEENPNAPRMNLLAEVELVKLRAEAHGILLKQFSLPPDTLGFIKAEPYKGTQKPLCLVTYTVPPKTLTKADIAADPVRYYDYTHIPGSRSFAATYEQTEPASPSGPPVYKKVAEVALPENATPAYVRLNNSEMVLVETTSAPPGKTGGQIPGAMLLNKGKLAELPAGPCAGPIMVPRLAERGLDGLVTDGLLTVLWAVRKTEGGLVMAEHFGDLFHWRQTITFEGENIVEIARKENDQWKPLFSAAEEKGISQEQAKLLGRFYGMREELKRQSVVVGSRYWSDPAITFDKDKRQWTLAYSWGRQEVAGGKVKIVLDEFGRLVDIDKFIVER